MKEDFLKNSSENNKGTAANASQSNRSKDEAVIISLILLLTHEGSNRELIMALLYILS